MCSLQGPFKGLRGSYKRSPGYSGHRNHGEHPVGVVRPPPLLAGKRDLPAEGIAGPGLAEAAAGGLAVGASLGGHYGSGEGEGGYEGDDKTHRESS